MERIQRGINKLDHAICIYGNEDVVELVSNNTVKNQADINLIRAYELKRRKQHAKNKTMPIS